MKSFLAKWNFKTENRQRGAALVSVILLLGLLSLLVTSLAIFVTNSATAIAIERERVMTDQLVRSALEFGMGRALSTPNEYPVFGEDRIRLQSGEALINWRAETARININLADEKTIAALWMSAGLTSEQSGLFARLVVARRTLDQTKPLPKEFQILRSSKLGPFQHIRELMDLPGMTADLFRRIEPLITIYNPVPTIDPRIAELTLLRALPDTNATTLAALADLRGRTDEDASRRLSAIGNTTRLYNLARQPIVRFSISIKTQIGANHIYDIVVIHFANDPRPYHVLAWIEKEPTPP